uniref:Uncharacterized protein n=1 Tax=Avena sativa TaxID=4498 RepID=A0ACD6AGZ5_AVESA
MEPWIYTSTAALGLDLVVQIECWHGAIARAVLGHFKSELTSFSRWGGQARRAVQSDRYIYGGSPGRLPPSIITCNKGGSGSELSLTTMYHWSASSSSAPCYSNGSGSSNGRPLLPSSMASGSSSSYGDHLLLQEQQQQQYYSSPPPMQRVMSAGDLQQAPVAAPAPAGRYSAEERRERIEKYRTKRNQRNFQKKITYACRKTLADSRPRVKGRFARNADDDAAADLPEDATATTTTSVPDQVSGFVDDGSSSMPPEWWPAMQGELAIEDEELITSYLAVSSINLY